MWATKPLPASTATASRCSCASGPASGDDGVIQLRRKEARADNVLAFFTQGELLLTLEGQDGRLLARWGAIGIGCAPEVCFAKSGKAVAACAKASGDADPLAIVPGLKEAAAAWNETVRKAVRGFDGRSPAEAEQLYASKRFPLKRLGSPRPTSRSAGLPSPSSRAERRPSTLPGAPLPTGPALPSSPGTACQGHERGHVLLPHRRGCRRSSHLYARLSPDMAGFARLKKSQPAAFVEDAGVASAIASLLGWALERENFTKAGAPRQGRCATVEHWEHLMDLCLFSELDNAPAFPRGRMANELRRGLEKDASHLKGTVTGRLAGDCLRDVKSNGWKYSKAVEQCHRVLLKQAFQTARHPPCRRFAGRCLWQG